MQEEFLKKQEIPSAKVVRIQRKTAQSKEDATTHAPTSWQLPAAKPQATSGFVHTHASNVMGEIMEKSCNTTQAVKTGSAALQTMTVGSSGSNSNGAGLIRISAALAAFPEATHRKESKFALSRKARLAVPAAAAAAAPPPAPAASAVPRAATSASAAATAPRGAPAPAAAAAAAAAATAADRPPEAQGMHIQTEQMLQNMNLDDVQSAVEEITSRFSPKALEFLRKRGAARAAAAAGVPAAASGSAAAPAAAAPQRQQRPAAQHAVTGKAPRPSLAADTRAGRAGAAGSAGRASAAKRSLQGWQGDVDGDDGDWGDGCEGDDDVADEPCPPGRGGRATASASGSCKPFGAELLNRGRAAAAAASTAAVTAAAPAPAAPAPKGDAEAVGGAADADAGEDEKQQQWMPVDPRLVARLRFDVDCQVVAIQPPDEKLSEAQVLQRDSLRQDEGSVPAGYTATELLLLARSSLPAQRAAALRLLAALLERGRPRPSDLAAAGGGPGGKGARRLIPLPEQPEAAAAAAGAGAGAGGAASTVSWQEVWDLLVRELGLASHLRLALDDDSAPVVAAAAGALAALVCAGAEERVTAELADCCPSTGWPCVRTAPLTRAHAGGIWEAKAVDAAVQLQQQQQQAPGQEAETAEDVACFDPLAGLLQMDVLQRLRYVLEVMRVEAAVPHILSVLCACARHSDAAAMAVVRCPRLMDVLKAMLLPGGDSVGTGSTSAAPSAPGGAQQLLHLQPQVLLLMRLLCQSSGLTAQLVRAAGVLPAVQGHLVMACASASPAAHQQLTALEALRLWRACAHHAVCPWDYEDVHEQLCGLLAPSEFAAAAATAAGGAEAADAGGSAAAGEGQDDQQQADADSASTSGGSAAAALRSLLSMHLCRELHLLLASLTSHALAIQRGDRTLGRPMLSPGAAAAVAQDAERLWLSPGAVRVVAGALVSQSDCGSLYEYGRWEGWCLSGLHPALLLPRAAVLATTYSSALHFLATYWGSVQAAHPRVFERVQAALARSGLCAAAAAAAGAPAEPAPGAAAGDVDSAQEQQQQQQQQPAGPQTSAADRLALELLRAPAPAPIAQPPTAGRLQQPLPRGVAAALLDHCVELAAEGAWAGGKTQGADLKPDGASAKSSTAAVGDAAAGDVMRNGSLQASAASLLHAVLRLCAALQRGAADAAPAAPAVPSAGAAAAAAAAATAAGLARQLRQHVARVLPRAAAKPSPAKAMQPWQLCYLQLQQPAVRLFLAACTLLDGTPSSSSTGGGATPVSAASAAAAAAVTEAALAVLRLSPPGAEQQCLTALRVALAPQRLQLLLQPLLQQYNQLKTVNPRLHAAASGVVLRHGGAPAAAQQQQPGGAEPAAAAAAAAASSTPQGGSSARVLYPAPTSISAESLSQSLFDGYSASWLSMVAADRVQEQQQPGGGAGGASGSEALLASSSALQPPLLDGAQGSRLPPPAYWLITEALVIPQPPRPAPKTKATAAAAGGAQQQQQQQQQAAPVHPMAGALTLVAALEQAASSSSSPGDLSQSAPSAATPPSPVAPSSSCSYLPLSMTPQLRLQCALQAAYVYNANELVQQQRRELQGGRGGAYGRAGGDEDEDEEGAGSGVWGDALARWSLALLTQQYACKGEEVHLPGDWCSSGLAEKLAEQFVTASFGDPLFAAHLALLLLPGTKPHVLRQVWSTLSQDRSLHLLPPLASCIGSPLQYASQAAVAAAAAQPQLQPGSDLVTMFAKSLGNGELDKALAVDSVAAAVACNAIITQLFGPPSSSAGTDSSSGSSGPGAAHAAAVCAVVHALPPQVLHRLMLLAQQQGHDLKQQAQVLAHACQGANALMDRLKSVLGMLGMV